MNALANEAVPPAALARPSLALALLAAAQFIIAVDYNIVYVALPSIAAALGFSARHLQWVISAYALAFGGFLLLGGRLGDVVGRRRAFVTALLLYAGSSLVGGLAQTPAHLITARAVQGLGGALLFPTTLSLISSYFTEGPSRNRALSVVGAAGASGGASGALLGGLLTSALGWNWTFFVNVPVAVVAVTAAFFLLPRDVSAPTRRGFDMPGALSVTAGVTLLVLAFVEGPELGWTSAAVLAMLGGAVALLAAFLFIESRSAAPLMPLRLLRHPTLPTAMLVAGLFAAGFGAQYYLLTAYLQEVRHYAPATAGLAFLPFSLSIVVGTRIGGRLANAVGIRSGLLIGLCIGIVGLLTIALSASSEGSYVAHMLPGFVIDGLGQGITWTLMWVAATTGIDALDRGVASGMASTAQQVGNALGLAVLVAVSVAMDTSPGGAGADAVPTGLRAAFLAAAGVVAMAAVVTWLRLPPKGSAQATAAAHSAPE
ncbi:MAG: putative transport protein [Rhodoferax sp.]|nr:putative transport protein [Rhodoferax sp.]